MSSAHEHTRGRWPGILTQLGVAPSHLRNIHGPCPMCGGKDRFRFDDKKGEGTFYCSKCGGGDGFRLVALIQGTDFKGAMEVVKPLIPTSGVTDIPAMRSKGSVDLNRMWQATKRVADGDPVDRYLAARGLPRVRENSLRYAPRALYRDDGGDRTLPAMFALVRDAGGHGSTIHRTFLAPDGRKADVGASRKFVSKFPDGGAVRLGGNLGSILGVAEGIETALSVTRLFKIPCWACLHTSGLKAFQWPQNVRELMIFGDHDDSFAGQAAAYALAQKARAKGLGVTVELPPKIGTDWNDCLMERLSSAD
jgi:putative DNA primase/helicase